MKDNCVCSLLINTRTDRHYPPEAARDCIVRFDLQHPCGHRWLGSLHTYRNIHVDQNDIFQSIRTSGCLLSRAENEISDDALLGVGGMWSTPPDGKLQPHYCTISQLGNKLLRCFSTAQLSTFDTSPTAFFLHLDMASMKRRNSAVQNLVPIHLPNDEIRPTVQRAPVTRGEISDPLAYVITTRICSHPQFLTTIYCKEYSVNRLLDSFLN